MIFTSSCCDNLSIDEIIERAEKAIARLNILLGFIIIAIAQLTLRTTKRPFTG